MVQKAGCFLEIISPNLNPDGGVGRTQKQNALKQFVIVNQSWKVFILPGAKKYPGIKSKEDRSCLIIEEILKAA